MEYGAGNKFSLAELLGLLLDFWLYTVTVSYGLLFVIHYFEISSPCFPHPPSAVAMTESIYFNISKYSHQLVVWLYNQTELDRLKSSAKILDTQYLGRKERKCEWCVNSAILGDIKQFNFLCHISLLLWTSTVLSSITMSLAAHLYILFACKVQNIFICSLKSYRTCNWLPLEFPLDSPIPFIANVASFFLGDPSIRSIKIQLMSKPQGVDVNGETTFSWWIFSTWLNG